MSGDAAAEQVRKESGGASWRPLLSASLFALILQPCSLEEGIRGHGVRKNGGNGEQELTEIESYFFGFSALGIRMNACALATGKLLRPVLGSWDSLGGMPAFHTVSIGIDR